MLILDATFGNGKKVQFAGNGIKIVGAIANPKSFQFMRLTTPQKTQLFIPLFNGSSYNVTTYKTVDVIRSNPNPLIVSMSYPNITRPLNKAPCPIINKNKFYNLYTQVDLPVETFLTDCNLQCIGKRWAGTYFQYVFYKY